MLTGTSMGKTEGKSWVGKPSSRWGNTKMITEEIRWNFYFYWVIPGRLNFMCRRFGTHRLFHLHRQCKKE